MVVVEEPLQSLMVTHIIRKGHEKTRTMDRRCSFLFKPCQKAPSLVFLVLMTSVVLLLQAPQVTGLRCYVCCGSTGRECEETAPAEVPTRQFLHVQAQQFEALGYFGAGIVC